MASFNIVSNLMSKLFPSPSQQKPRAFAEPQVATTRVKGGTGTSHNHNKKRTKLTRAQRNQVKKARRLNHR